MWKLTVGSLVMFSVVESIHMCLCFQLNISAHIFLVLFCDDTRSCYMIMMDLE